VIDKPSIQPRQKSQNIDDVGLSFIVVSGCPAEWIGAKVMDASLKSPKKKCQRSNRTFCAGLLPLYPKRNTKAQ